MLLGEASLRTKPYDLLDQAGVKHHMRTNSPFFMYFSGVELLKLKVTLLEPQ